MFFQHDSDFSFQADSIRTDMKEMKLIAVSSLQEEKTGACLFPALWFYCVLSLLFSFNKVYI